jgi:tripartite motif-containing protein 71
MEHYFKGMWGTFGTNDGQFKYPMGIAVDSGKNMYVADTFNSRIQKFTKFGIFIDKCGSYGTGNGEFYYPTGIAVDSNNNIYVVDS